MTHTATLPLTNVRISFPRVDPPDAVALEDQATPWGEFAYRYFGGLPGEPAANAVRRLAEVVPELPGLRLERIGDATDGVTVLRSGDLRSAAGDGPDPDTDALIRATNVLLARAGATFRFVPLRAMADDLLYAAASPEECVELLHAGLLALADLGELLDLASF